jgi:hypothetical protein
MLACMREDEGVLERRRILNGDNKREKLNVWDQDAGRSNTSHLTFASGILSMPKHGMQHARYSIRSRSVK